MSNGWDLIEIKNRIAQFHERGNVSEDVIQLVVSEGYCAPIESEIFDYKETQDNSPLAIAKLIRHIVSFYNSYGGYLLFGVQETVGETIFKVAGVSEQIIDLESLKAKIREYVGERIQIAGAPMPSSTVEDEHCNLFLLFIPKRPENGRPPLHFTKDAPQQIFRKNDVYHRLGDESIEAKGPPLFALSLPRPNPYLNGQTNWNFENLITRRIENNLPDRNFICPHFVGREAYLDKLWRWLGDDLAYVKMLAGEGGRGKTSIAYEFANRVSQTKNIPFEQVIWLTAKRLQFAGQQDDFVLVPETHYSSYEELLKAIVERLPLVVNDDELAAMSIDDLRRQARDGLSAYPSFVIVDDIDSLDNEQQRQVVELGFLLGSVKSKILLTTRHNRAYSHDIAITINGFDSVEFGDYLSSLRERNILQRDLDTKEKKRLLDETDGSPLYTESVCRLLRFQAFDEAIKGWGKDAGARVRAAALDREVSMLSPESRRVLLTAALLSEASKPEISEITEYPQDVVLQCIQELSSLFLLAGETLADQPRFSVPDNTVRLVLERASTLVTDHTRLKDRVAQARGGNKVGKNNDRRIGLVIAQAKSMMRLGFLPESLETIDDASKRFKNNPDLLGFRAELLMKFSPPRFDEARRNARDAFHISCRRPAMFFAWFEAEWEAGHFVGAEEAAKAAISNAVPGNGDWWVKLAAALVSRAEDQKVGASIDRKIVTFLEASSALDHSIKFAHGAEVKQWERIQYDVHDRIWKLLEGSLADLDGVDLAVDALEKVWRAGDMRFSNANHAIAIGEAICSYLESPLNRRSAKAIHAAGIRMERCQKLIAQRKAKYPDDTRHPYLDESVDRVYARYALAISRQQPVVS